MLPGGRGVNPRQMQMMMKRLGMSTEPIEGVEEVIVRTATEEHVFLRPEVTVLTVQGVRTYQVVGEPKIRPRSHGTPSAPSGPGEAPPAPPPGPPEEDVKLVMEQAQADRATAIRALEECGGEPAEAILHLLSRRGDGGR
jgi:nascent polypeptide-associated complex subunit alpha